MSNKINELKKVLLYSLVLFAIFFVGINEVSAEDVTTFSYTGNVQSFIVPDTDYYQIELWGAQGGSTGYKGGMGSYTSGNILLEKGKVIYIYVGGAGARPKGGYNGGGNAVSSGYTAGGGGGATDIRIFTSTPTEQQLVWNSSLGLASRIMVAAGGGGAAYYSYGTGGAGGGLVGNVGVRDSRLSASYRLAQGGTQTSGGAYSACGSGYCDPYPTSGSFGTGGNSSSVGGYNGGGGGAGYYGGGGGASGYSFSGAGGSSFISGHAGCNAILAPNGSTITHSGQSIHYSGYYFTDTVMIDGNSQMPGKTTGYTTGSSGNGYAKITKLNIQVSDNNYLKKLESNVGTLSPSFDPIVNDYTIVLDKYTTSFTLTGELADSTAKVIGFKSYDISLGETIRVPIAVTAQNGDVRIYNVSVTRPALLPGEHSSKLVNLTVGKDNYKMEPKFDPEVYEYTMEIPYNVISLDVDYQVFDPDATVTVTGNGYIKNGKNGTITVTVTNPYCETTIYKVNLIREGVTTQADWDYDYTGGYQTFTAEYAGYYQIELWGAQGGSTGYKGGAGSYTSGKIFLEKNQTIYIYVGGAGSVPSGGYNGGGKSQTSYTAAGGGGATDVRIFANTPTNQDLVWNSTLGLSSRIMVAAGGGGAAYNGYGIGGAGGGLVGNVGTRDWRLSASYMLAQGGTQTSGGAYSKCGPGYCSPYPTSGSFGTGGTASTVGGYKGGGGGAGYYGGGGGASGYSFSGAGGSSFISGHDGCDAILDPSTTSSIMHSGQSIHYSGFYFKDTVMIDGNGQMPGKTSGYTTGNSGNGHARISKLDVSENNFLSCITVKVDKEEKKYTPEYDLLITDYYLEFAEDETHATISAKPEDSKATITGLGEIEIPAGDNVYPIEVTAESGAVKVYNVHIHRPASSNSYPIDITINGLVPSLCSQESSIDTTYCSLNPTKFDANTHIYYLTVPSRIKQLWFDVVKGHDYQTVNGNGKVSLDGGENVITIEVTSEDGSSTQTYTYYVTRDMTGNTDLSVLNILDPEFNLNYDPDIFEYYLTVPNQYDTYQMNDTNEKDDTISNILQIYTKADDENAKITVTGDKNLLTGMNDIGIVVVAQNGNVNIYTLHVYREKNSNVFLKNLEVWNNDIEYSLKPKFNSLYFGTYQVTVPNEVTKVQLIATAQAPNTTKIMGAGEKVLTVGNNQYSIILTAEDGSVETYKISIVREKNGNANLSNIVVSDNNDVYLLTPTFDSDTTEYSVTVNEGVSSAVITATPEVSTTTYRLLDSTSLKVGNNVKRVMAVSENGNTKIYTLNIYRPANSNNYLSDIIVTTKSNNLTYVPTFDRETLSYTLEVPNDIKSVTVTGTKEHILSRLTGNGTYGLAVGENVIHLIVTSETNEERMYTITITRKANTNAYLKSISTSQGILSPTFDKETYKYTVNIENTVDSLLLSASPEVSTTKVTPNNTNLKNLKSGTTTVEFKTLAEDGITTLTYTVDIIKDKSDNDNATYILMEEGALHPNFNSNIVFYTVDVPNDITKGTFHVELEDSNATYQIINNNNFQVGKNEVIVRVFSESNLSKDYTIIVNRQEKENTSNYLSSLTVSTSKLIPDFNKEIEYYEVEVPYTTTNISVGATLEDSNATLVGPGEYNLTVGKNVIVVTVTGKDGKIRDYQIVVTRKKNNEARLSALALSDMMLSPTFDKDITNYTVSTTKTSLSFSKIVPMDKNATYEVLNNEFTTVGQYEVIIRVTAQDGVTTKDYILNVLKNPSNNNNLENLYVEDYSMLPNFNKATTLYTLTVPNGTNSIVIHATAEDKNSTIYGDGVQELAVGTNNLVIKVESESGNTKAYTIVVTRLGNNDNTLKDLIVHNGIINPEFQSSTTSYQVKVPYSEEELDLTVVLNDENARYVVMGNRNFKVGHNQVSVVVTAEDGSTNIYALDVIRDNIISALLKDIEIENYEFTETFNSNVFHYTLKVGNETEQLNMNIIPLDEKATYTVTGNENFIVGNNTVTIQVTSSDGKLTEVYTLDVERQTYANNFLDYLYTDQGDVTPKFEKTTMKYYIGVANDVTQIELIGELVDHSATVTGLGTYSLNTGDNVFKIIVTANNGNVRTYYVTVNRAKKNANDLLSLQVKNGTTTYPLTPEFNKETLEYTVNIPVGIPSVTLNGTVSENATVTGLGTKSLTTGVNTALIEVTSESGIKKTYQVNLIREASDNNHLIELIPSVGTLTPTFTYPNTDYTIYLDSSASSLEFTCTKEDLFATISGNERMLIPDGTSTREIIVTAENGDKRIYTITVVKERSDNALLSSLAVDGYTFEEPFNPTTFEYHVTVPNSKTTLTSSNVTAVAQDSNARITKMTSLSLSTKNENEYLITVTAPDKFTEQTYKIIVTRQLGSSHTLTDIKVNIGKLTSTFEENKLEYEWIIPKSRTSVTKNDVIVTPKDINSVITMPDSITITGTNDIYTIRVEAEDGSGSTEYQLKVSLDLSAVTTLKDLSVDRGIMQPQFNSDIYTYDVYEYVDCDEVYVSATTSSENAKILSGIGRVELTDPDTIHYVVIEAEDGTLENYTLRFHKTISTEKGLKNLGLNGLENVDCSNDKCELTPNFQTNIISYTIKVPYEYTQLDIFTETMNEQQTVKYKINGEEIGLYSLPVGATTVTIEVYDGLNKLTREYTLTVERVKSSNPNLKDLTITYVDGIDEVRAPLVPVFDKNILEYTIEIPSTVSEVEIHATPEDKDARIVIDGYNYLQDGNNDATIEVTAPDGTKKTYLVHIIKNPEYNSYLKNITVSTGIFWDLEPNFKPTVFEYTTTISGVYGKATIEAVPVDPTTKVAGTGEYELKTGSNIVTLVATASDGSVSVYKINVIKTISRNVNLMNLIVEEGNLSPAFEKGTTKYDVNVGSEVEKLTMHVVLEDKTSTYVITGNEHLVSGDNVVNVIVLSQDKSSSKTYQITVHKALSTNTELTEIKVMNKDDPSIVYPLLPDFNSKQKQYKVYVDSTIQKVLVDAKAKSGVATIAGLGEESLQFGSNLKEIIVTAEDGTIDTYVVDIYRNYNLNLSSIVSDVGTLNPVFNKDTVAYTIDVDKETNAIVFIAFAESDKVTVEGNGEYQLSPGDNEIIFTVKAPDGNKKEYKVNVRKEASDNNYIESLVVHEGRLEPDFEKTHQKYDVSVKKSVTSLTMGIMLEDKNATYEVIGNHFNGIGDYKVIVRVTAENKETRDYEITVHVLEDSEFSNRLLNLSISDGTLNPDFDPDTNYYVATVPNGINSTIISATRENLDAKITGIGQVNLEVGRNTFYVTVTSKDGIDNVYTLVIYRNGNNDATLSSLSVTNQNFMPIFDKTIENYTMTVDGEVTNLEISAIPTEKDATVEITGDKNLTTGNNTVQIKVTAPDGITTKMYTIEVEKTLSTNNYLSSLEVVGYDISPEFIKTNQGPYTVEVENDVNSVVVNAMKESSKAMLTGDGRYNLTIGQNIISLQVTSESGDVRIYTVIVTRKANSDSTLKQLVISDGILNPNFDPSITEYEVKIEDILEEITVIGFANSATSTVSGNGKYDLDEYETNISLTVTAQDKSTTTYTIKVLKGEKPDETFSSKLSELVIKQGELTPSFHKNTIDYSIKVPYEITSLEDMIIQTEDQDATYEVVGNSNFKVGNNEMKIVVTAKDNSSTTTYTIMVNRQIQASNYLASLVVDDYTLTPSFHKLTLYYEVTVPNNTDSVEIKATAEDSSSTVKGTGTKTLQYGKNTFYVTVTSSSGSVRTYTVVINRTETDENLLLTLQASVGTLTPEFSSTINEYTLTVPEKTTSLELSGTASPNSKVIGFGVSNVTLGEQTRTITVTSQTGNVNIYTVKVVRPASKNTNLISLIPSVGSLEYSNDILEYQLEVEDNDSVISFTAEPEDQDATITGCDLTTLEYSENEIIITVIAEDGVTTREIKVNVMRKKGLIEIVPTETEITIGKGETEKIMYALNPSDTDYPEVEWESSDENIVTVDENGVVTGKSFGSTTVQIRSSHNPNIMATVTVNVISKEITSSIYEIYKDTEVRYTIGADPKTGISDFIKNFDNNPSTLFLYDIDGNQIEDLSSYVGSYMVIKLIIKDVTYDELEIGVRGDLDGDGMITVADMTTVKNIILKIETPTFIMSKVADTDGDELTTVADMTKIKNYILKTVSSLNP